MSDKSSKSDLKFTTIPPDLHELFYNLQKEIDSLNKKLQAAEEKIKELEEKLSEVGNDQR